MWGLCVIIRNTHPCKSQHRTPSDRRNKANQANQIQWCCWQINRHVGHTAGGFPRLSARCRLNLQDVKTWKLQGVKDIFCLRCAHWCGPCKLHRARWDRQQHNGSYSYGSGCCMKVKIWSSAPGTEDCLGLERIYFLFGVRFFQMQEARPESARLHSRPLFPWVLRWTADKNLGNKAFGKKERFRSGDRS